MAIDNTQIGKRIRYYRTKAGMSQDELASALFISRGNYISRLETGKDTPSLELIISMARLFHIRTDDLLGVKHSSTEGGADDCAPEVQALLVKITAAIKEILVEDYKK